MCLVFSKFPSSAQNRSKTDLEINWFGQWQENRETDLAGSYPSKKQAPNAISKFLTLKNRSQTDLEN